jgi:hypothetical protein
MGIVDLKTNLKSLRYTKDRVGGGSSNQPYITRDLPGNPNLPFSAAANADLSGVDRSGGPDVLLRGGTLTPGRAVRDVSRLAQMFFDFKSIGGPLFIAKENLLSRTSVATDGKGKALNNGVYLPTSTLLQAAGNSLGLHLNKQGIDPFKGIGKDGGGIFELFGGSDPLGQPSYIEITSDSEHKSKLISFTDKKINEKTDSTELLNYQGGPGSILGIGKTRIPLPPLKQRTGINNPKVDFNKEGNYHPSKVSWSTKAAFQDNGFGFNNSLNITQNTDPFGSNFSFNSGQFIVGTTGKTDVVPFRSISPTVTDPEAQEKINNDQFLRLGASVKYASNPNLITKHINIFKESWLSNGKLKLNPESFTVGDDILNRESSKNNPSITEDYRKNTISLSYADSNIETRVGLGNPGKKGYKGKNDPGYDYQAGKKDANGDNLGALDKVNSLRLYKSGVVTQNKEKNDLVKFRIGIIQNDDPSQKVFIHFRAFLDSMSDDYTADWSSDKFMGRGENFYRYNGFDRKISLGWTVVAQSKEELIPMYQKLNYLASSLAPDYSKTIGYMRGNLATLTVGGYLYEQPGIITGLSYSVPEESPWEIAIPTNPESTVGTGENKIKSDKSVKEMPHMIKVTGFNFIPIHEFTPKVQSNRYSKSGKLTGFGKERYIALNNGFNNNYVGEFNGIEE